MRYVVSLDWLALYCLMDDASATWVGVSGSGEHLVDAAPWVYKVEDYGTRQFRHLCRVMLPNDHGGKDEFAEIQYEPCSTIIDPRAVIVRFVNRVLYLPNFWDLASNLLVDNGFRFHNVSRCDICADFNKFESLAPLALIRGFANKSLRHVGRGVGAMYFDHGVKKIPGTRYKEYGVNYTGLSFGTHSSDARVYLYNKTFELQTQADKPYIRDTWRCAGLDVSDVWRLEVSIKSKACTFTDKTTGGKVTITNSWLSNREIMAATFHTFVRKLFAFVSNRPGITNITREPRIRLFDGAPCYDRAVIREVSGGNRLEKMVIKALWTFGDRYRGEDAEDAKDTARAFAGYLASATDLGEWTKKRADSWRVDSHK